MLLYSRDLAVFFKKHVLPHVLVNPNSYELKGSFRRQAYYVTDIDVVNDVRSTMDAKNFYERLMGIIKNQPSHLKLLLVGCGCDERFCLRKGDEEEVKGLYPFLSSSTVQEIQGILNKYQSSQERLFYLNEIVWPLYKIRWTVKEIKQGFKILIGDKKVDFIQTANTYPIINMQFSVIYHGFPVGVDVVVYTKGAVTTGIYDTAHDYYFRLSNYKKEYYYMLFPFGYYYRSTNKEIAKQIYELTEKTFGLYKQITVRIDHYHLLYLTGNLDIRMAGDVVQDIVADCNRISAFRSDLKKKYLWSVVRNQYPTQEWVRQWDEMLETLRQELTTCLNAQAKPYFFKYLAMVPESDRGKFLIEDVLKSD